MIGKRALDQLIELFVEGDIVFLEQFLEGELVDERGLPADVFRALRYCADWNVPREVQGEGTLVTGTDAIAPADAISAAFAACGTDRNLGDTLSLYLLSVCERTWENSWIHTPIDAAVAATAASYSTQFAVPPDEVALIGLLRLLSAELLTEGAAVSRSLRALKDEATRTSLTAVELVRRFADTELRPVDELALEVARRQALYYGLVASAAEASYGFLTGDNPDLDEVISRLELAETDALLDEVDRSELRAHRFDLESLAIARDRDILRIDAGRIIYQFPFGLTGLTGGQAVAAIRERVSADETFIAGLEVVRVDRDLVLNDVWTSGDLPGTTYTGAEVHFASLLHPELPEIDGTELHISVRVSDLGNHCLRMSCAVTDILPHQLHILLARVAMPAFPRPHAAPLRDTQHEHPFRHAMVDGPPPNLRGLAARVISSLIELMASSADGMEDSGFSPSTFSVITQIHRATALRVRDFTVQRPLDALSITQTLGFEQFLAPCPQGYNSVAAWVSRGKVDPASLGNLSTFPHDLLLWHQNNIVLTASSVPLYRTEEECTAVEFVSSLAGMLDTWHTALIRYYAAAEEAHSQVPAALLDTCSELIASVLTAHRLALATDSAALVESAETRHLIDRLLNASRIGSQRDRLLHALDVALNSHACSRRSASRG